MTLYKVFLRVKGWSSDFVIEWVRANTEQEAISNIKNHSIYHLTEYKVLKIVKA